MLNQRMKLLREEKKLSQKQLADMLDMGITAVNNYENGNRIPTADVVIKLSEIFGVSTDYLLGINEYRTPAEAQAIDRDFESLSSEKKELCVMVQKALVRCAATYQLNSMLASQLFSFMADDCRNIINAYVHLVEDNDIECNIHTDPHYFIDTFLSNIYPQHLSSVITYLATQGSIMLDDHMRRKVESQGS